MHLFDRIYSKAVVYIEKNCQDSDCPIIDVLYLSSATANFVIRNPHPEQYFKMLTDAIRQNADEKMLPVIIYIAKYLVAFKLQNHGEDNRTLSEIKNFLHEKTINDKWLYDLCDPPDFENYHNYDFHDFDGCITVEENVVPLAEWNVQPELKVPLNQAHLLLDTLKAKDKFGNDMIREDDFKKVVGLFDNFIINGVVPELRENSSRPAGMHKASRKCFTTSTRFTRGGSCVRKTMHADSSRSCTACSPLSTG